MIQSKALIKLSLVLLIGLQIWFIYISNSFPVMGAALTKNQTGHWIIKKIEPRNSVEQFGLKAGDEILQVNGAAPEQFPSIQRWNTIDQASSVLVGRSGQQWTVSFEDLPNLSGYDTMAVIIAVISILSALMLLRKLPQSRSAQYLAFVLLDFETVFMSLGASVRGEVLGKVSICVSLMLLPILFLHFFVIFFKEKSGLQLSVRMIKYLYAPIVISAAMWVPTMLSHVSSDSAVYHFNTNFSLFYFVFGIILDFGYLGVIYLKHRSEKSYISTVITTVCVALFLSFSPIIVFSFIPTILFGHVWINSFYMSGFVFLFPMTLAYLVLTNKLYDIHLVLRRILIIALIATVPSCIFTAALCIFFTKDATSERLFILFLMFLIILTQVLYSLEYFITKLEPVLFPRKYILQSALKKISKNLGSITSVRQLKDIILVDIVSTLEVTGGAIVFKFKDSVEIIHEGSMDTDEVREVVLSGRPFHNLYSRFEINRNEEYTSYLVMLPKKAKTTLGTEEMQWLNLIITYLSVSLENVHLIRKLTAKLENLAAQLPNEQAGVDFIWFRKLMFELQEKERVRIATDLHDTTMQDLFFLKGRLHTLLERNSYTREDQAQMISIIDYIDIINSNLRQSCFELHPYLLKEIGLVQTIEKLVESEAAISPFQIEFAVKHVDWIESRDLETKRHVFRVIQELINNAKKHAQASHITIHLTAADYHVYLTYEDDGVGFEPKHTTVQEIGSHGIGMEQMKSRILSLNGQFEIRTSRGKGFKFSVKIPWREGQSA